MKEIVFYVQGSADYPYEVSFIRHTPEKLLAYCSCPAGQNGQYCKHRFNILAGSTLNIVSENKNLVPTVISWLPGTNLEAALKKVHLLEEEEAKLKKSLAAAKKELAKAMRD